MRENIRPWNTQGDWLQRELDKTPVKPMNTNYLCKACGQANGNKTISHAKCSKIMQERSKCQK